MATPRPLQVSGVLIASAIAITPQAIAERRTPAPIEYAGQGSVPRPNSSATQDSWRGPVTRTDSVVLPDTREKLSFSYPGTSGSLQSSYPGPQMASVENQPRAFEPQSAAKLWPAEANGSPINPPPAAATRTLTLGPGSAVATTKSIVASAEPLAASVMPEEHGLASWYGADFHGNPTANGEIFDMGAMTAAHRTLPLPSLVQVTNETNGKEIVVRVNDRGPFIDGRIIDLSKRAAEALDIIDLGAAPVTVRYLGPAPGLQSPPTSYASVAQEKPAVQMAELEPLSPPRPDLYGDMLLGGIEPTLGVPDPGQAIATPARLTPDASTPVPASASGQRVLEASLLPVPSEPVRTDQWPQPTLAAMPPASSRNAPVFTPQIFVQVGSFADISNAQGMNAKVGGGYPVDIESVRVSGADYFRVLVGPFSTRDAAERAKVQLRTRGVQDSFVVVR